MEINKNKILKICNVVWSAGERIKSIYSKKFKIFKKKDFTPVTTADLESERIIIEGLEKIFNKPKIFTEETNFKNQKSIKNFWLVDPLDGTKEFIKKNGEFTVNVAFIKNKKPFFGIIYAPILKKTYVGIKNKTYKVINKKSFREITPKKKINKTIIISRSHSSKKDSHKLKKKYNANKVLFLGSSLKFCYIAEGIAQVYPRIGTTYEWDTAAGHAIINGVGGKVETKKGTELKYGKKDFKNTDFIAKKF